jgi:hypothetical protein
MRLARSRSLPLLRAAAIFALACCAVLPALPSRADAPAQSSWKDIDRVVAFADVHGAYAELSRLLQAAGVVDKDLKWSAGRTHVVSLGDLLDRGADSRKVMDLLMRLQGEAAAAGGELHVLIGNHEAMDLLGDLRYVTVGEYAAFAAEEPAGVRERERAEWISREGPDSGPGFDQRFPPGYFGHRAALSPRGKYGQWLLALPAAIAINDTLFMHGGPSNALAGMSLQEINLRYRTALADYVGTLAELETAGLLREDDDFNRRPSIALERLAALAVADESAHAKLAAAVQRLQRAYDNPMLRTEGPNWYRGAALCNACSESDVLLPILEGLHLSRLVVGHTVARNSRVATRFDGKVVKLDAGMNRAAYHGRPAALILEDGKAMVLYADEPAAPTAIPAEPLYVAPENIDDSTVAGVLASGNVTLAGPRAPGVLDAVVELDGRKVPAVFVAAGDDAVNRELAAYRLDRLLQLGIVPATAAREVQGQRGYVQARPEKWVTQTDVQTQSLRGGGWCAMEPQFELVYAFDALTGNEGRTPERLLFDTQEWAVLATGHDRGFGTGKAFPAYLKARPPAPGAELRRRLAALTDATLAQALDGLVTARERRAILERRDALLALPPTAAAAQR